MSRQAGPENGAAALLLEEIVDRIRSRGTIPFDEFMDMALYREGSGYYQRGPARLGPGGDFYTASDVSSAFGERLAVEIAELSRALCEGPVDLVELGAGGGTLATDVLGHLRREDPALYERLTYWIVERSEGMRRAQHEALASHRDAGTVRWAARPEAVRAGGIVGCVLANEFYDALPVRVVTRRGGTRLERRVGLEGNPPMPAWVDAAIEDPELAAYADLYGLTPVDGTVAEAGLAAREFARRVARSILRGFQIVIDYGDRAERLYDPRIRPAGTLLGYHRHRVVDAPFSRIGEQDLTAHVNFSAIEDAGRDEGMVSLGLTTQDRFLISLGLADRIAELAASSETADVRRRLAMMTLIHPEAMGRTFHVLVQSKGVGPMPVTGLLDPFASEESPSPRVL